MTYFSLELELDRPLFLGGEAVCGRAKITNDDDEHPIRIKDISEFRLTLTGLVSVSGSVYTPHNRGGIQIDHWSDQWKEHDCLEVKQDMLDRLKEEAGLLGRGDEGRRAGDAGGRRGSSDDEEEEEGEEDDKEGEEEEREGDDDKDVVIKRAGERDFPFSLQLPQAALSSFTSRNSRIDYKLVLTFNGIDEETEELTVLDTVDLNLLPPSQSAPQSESRQFNKSLSGLLPCIKSGPLSVTASLGTPAGFEGFVPGEHAPVKLQVQNECNRLVKVGAQLHMKVNFSDGGVRVDNEKLFDLEEVCSVDEGANFSGTHKLKIPNVVPSFLGRCKYFDVEYVIRVTVEAAETDFDHREYDRTIEFELPVVVGNVPYKHAFPSFREPNCDKAKLMSAAAATAAEHAGLPSAAIVGEDDRRLCLVYEHDRDADAGKPKKGGKQKKKKKQKEATNVVAQPPGVVD